MSAPEKVVDFASYPRPTPAEKKKLRRVKQRKLLYECYAPVLLPDLALDIGEPAACLVQQIYWWIRKKRSKISPRPKFEDVEVYNSIEEWQLQFPNWTTRTIERAIKVLEKREIIKTRKGRVHGDRVTFFKLKLNLFDAKHRRAYEERAAERSKKMRAIARRRRFHGKEKPEGWWPR